MFRQSLGALALVAALAVPFVASAQSAPGPQADPNAPVPAAGAPAPGGRHHHHHRGGSYMRAMRNLNLSDAQKSQIKAIVKQARAANAAKAGAPVDPQTRRANMVALRQQIEGVLTDAQRAQLHANLQRQRQARNAAGQAPAPAPAPPAQPQ